MGDGGRSLDYVVFGIGFGATLLVLGLLIRDFGTRLRFRSPTGADGVLHAEELVARVSWSRFCGALGTVWATAGLAFIVITVVCMLFMVSDARAGWVMGISFLLLLVAMAFWTWAFFDRFGSYGILPERDVVDERPVVERAPAEAPEVVKDHDGHGVVASDDTSIAPEHVTTGSLTSSDNESVTDERLDDTSPEATATETPSLPTPEERMAAATSPMDHESHEADLDTLAPASSRPQRQAFRPAPADMHSDTSSDTADAAESGSDMGKEDDGRTVAKPSVESCPQPESRPRES